MESVTHASFTPPGRRRRRRAAERPAGVSGATAHSADSAAGGLSTPAVTSPMMTRPSAIRYQANGMKLLVETYFMNHARTA